MPVWRRGSSRSAERLREASGHLRGRSGAPWNASLPIWRYRHSGRLLPPASPRFARAATACGAGSERRQSAVPQVRAMPCRRACGPARWGKRLSYGNGFAIFSRYVTEPPGSPVRKLSPDARYPAFRVDSGDCLALEGDFGTPVVRYGNISKIFFDSITVSEETGRCGRASSRDRRLARRRGARDARRSVADPGNRRSTLLPRALRRAGAPCLPSSRGNAAIERQARGACPAKKPNPRINQWFPRRRTRRLLAQRPLRAAASRRARAPSSRGPPPSPRAADGPLGRHLTERIMIVPRGAGPCAILVSDGSPPSGRAPSAKGASPFCIGAASPSTHRASREAGGRASATAPACSAPPFPAAFPPARARPQPDEKTRRRPLRGGLPL